MDMADRMVQDGYRDLGYEFVNIDVSKKSLSVSLLLSALPLSLSVRSMAAGLLGYAGERCRWSAAGKSREISQWNQISLRLCTFGP